MATETPNGNVELTFEQLQQIATVKDRVTKLETEINLAATKLTQTRKELEVATKAKEYEEGLLAEVTSQKESVIKQLQVSKEELETAKDTVLITTQKANELMASAEIRDTKSKNELDKLKLDQEVHLKNIEAFQAKNNKFEQEKFEVSKARKILETAINNINL